MVLGASPSKKSIQRLKTRVGELLVPSNIDPWPEVRDKLNRSLRGWSNYFGYGSRSKAYRSVDQYVFERVRRFLARRHKVQGRGNRRFIYDVIHRELGVLCLQRFGMGNGAMAKWPPSYRAHPRLYRMRHQCRSGGSRYGAVIAPRGGAAPKLSARYPHNRARTRAYR